MFFYVLRYTQWDSMFQIMENKISARCGGLLSFRSHWTLSVGLFFCGEHAFYVIFQDFCQTRASFCWFEIDVWDPSLDDCCQTKKRESWTVSTGFTCPKFGSDLQRPALFPLLLPKIDKADCSLYVPFTTITKTYSTEWTIHKDPVFSCNFFRDALALIIRATCRYCRDLYL